MAKNFVQHGDTVDIPAPSGGFIAGFAYKIGELVGIPASTVDQGQVSAFHVEGVFDFLKASEQVSIGQLLKYSTANNTVGSSGDFEIGHALEALSASAPRVKVRLMGGRL